MYLKDDKIDIRIGNSTFRSYSHADPQFILDPDAIVGWDDGPSTRRASSARANGWGDFAERSQQGSRVINISGTARAGNIRGLSELRDELVGLFADGGYQEMSVETSEGIRYASVGIEGAPSWVRKGDTLAVWKLGLYAPDPRLYSLERRTQLGGGESATGLTYPIRYPLYYGNNADRSQGFIGNAGNTESWPKFVAQGSMPHGFVIHNNAGRSVSFTGMVSPQAPVVVDMLKGTATQNGVDKTTLLNRRDWFSIGANSSLVPGFDPIQNGQQPITNAWCDILYRDTWI